MTCDTDGVGIWAKGEKATLVKIVTLLLKRDRQFREILMNALENILAELAKEGGEA